MSYASSRTITTTLRAKGYVGPSVVKVLKNLYEGKVTYSIVSAKGKKGIFSDTREMVIDITGPTNVVHNLQQIILETMMEI